MSGQRPACWLSAVRGLLAALLADGILGSDTPKGPLSLRFPQHAAEVLVPDLFPEL